MFLFLFKAVLSLTILFDVTLARPSSHLSRQTTSISKAGLAWANADSVDIDQFRTTGKVSWYYSWSPFPTDTDLEFVSMFWGSKSIDQFTSTINDTISKRGVKTVLGMNEPQQTGQSNISPADGASLWKTYLEPLRAQGIRLGSPAPSSAPSGKTWLQDFFTACNGGCTVDFIALHWYDVNATQFIEYLEDFHTTFNKTIWVTEWSCQNFNDVNKQCSPDDIALFLHKTQSYMDNATFVERYAWFGALQDLQGVNPGVALIDHDGKINTLGKQYIGAESAQTTGGGSADGPDAPGGSSGGGGLTISYAYAMTPSYAWAAAPALILLASLVTAL